MEKKVQRMRRGESLDEDRAEGEKGMMGNHATYRALGNLLMRSEHVWVLVLFCVKILVVT